jgi:VCBS repeat-containing protein
VFVQQTAALNNKPSLYFDGVNDLLRCASAIGSSDTEGTVVMVILTSTDVITEQALFASEDEASATKFFRLGINNGGWRYNQNDAGTADTLDAGTAGASTAYLVVWQSDGSTINGEYNNYSMLLGETSGANTGDWLGDTSARDSTCIGGSNANNTPAKWFKGWIADMAVYSRKITTSEVNKLKKYVKARYSI